MGPAIIEEQAREVEEVKEAKEVEEAKSAALAFTGC
jgi:hypothetical protein